MSLRILITFHSSSQDYASMVGDHFKSKGFDIYYMNELTPEKLSTRTLYVKQTDLFVSIASLKYQKSILCMELLHYAKDLRMNILGINFYDSYIPFGAYGAIISGTELGLIDIDDTIQLELNFTSALNLLEKLKSNNNKKEKIEIINSSRAPSAFVNINYTNIETDVVISYHQDSKDISVIIEEALQRQNINFVAEDTSKGTSSATTAKVIIIILSPGYEDNFNCKTVVEKARSLNKKIIPISKTRDWKPSNWLGLITAGKLFYRIMSREQAYTLSKNSEFNPITILIDAVIIALNPITTQDKREELLVESLKKQIEECKTKLSSWPPKIKVKLKKEKVKPVKVTFEVPKSDILLNRISYTVTRINTTQPRDIFDKNGIPIRKTFDCMISYQWDNQEFVKKIFMNFYVQNLDIWFDIWGGMEGNANEAMATAIENSKVILVFLSNKYLNSPNCLLEIKYGIYCGKSFIFIIVEPLKTIEPWIQEQLNQYLKFEINNIDQAINEHINGIPKINVISKAIRDIGFPQPDYEVTDFSDEVFELKQILNSALDEIAQKSGSERFKTCTRCKKKYEELNNKIGDCKYHSAYYMGGTLLAARWVCCDQTETNSVGCVNTTHTDNERKWTLNKDYGTYTWEPK